MFRHACEYNVLVHILTINQNLCYSRWYVSCCSCHHAAWVFLTLVNYICVFLLQDADQLVVTPQKSVDVHLSAFQSRLVPCHSKGTVLALILTITALLRKQILTFSNLQLPFTKVSRAWRRLFGSVPCCTPLWGALERILEGPSHKLEEFLQCFVQYCSM